MRRIHLFTALLFVCCSSVAQTNDQGLVADQNTQQIAAQPELQPLAQRPIPPPPVPATPGRIGKAPASERYRYDPSAKVGDPDLKGSKESSLEKGLKRINSNNVDYGGLLATWRVAVVQETIESLYFWIIVFLCGAVGIMSTYVAWLLHEMDRRRHVAGSMVTQLWNAAVHAKGKALDAIEAHNKLVEELDAMDGATAAPKKEVAGATTTPVVETSQTGEPPTPSNTPGFAAPVTRPGDDELNWLNPEFAARQTTPNLPSEQNDTNHGRPLAVIAARRAALPVTGLNDLSSPVMVVDGEQLGETPETADAPSDQTNTVANVANDPIEIQSLLESVKEQLAIAQAQIISKDIQLGAKEQKIGALRENTQRLVSEQQELKNRLKGMPPDATT